jgi:myosin heavy subunit
MKKVQYIGCLDIAGFEIFDYNGFEQICINFVNEKLQQFFNQHMFTLEQEEYVREGIEWANVDFGMDLQVCITMFEKPMGLLAIWEEESLFPKASDETFRGKLMDNLLGKPNCQNFQKPDPRAPDKNAHFGVAHYAAMVSYNLTGWLEKNKDPLNDTVVELMKNGSNKLLIECFHDHPGQPLEAKKDAGGGGKKKGGGKTVTSFFKSQLDDLMKVLYSTDPSFIRCVVPNTHKQPGGVQADLIMHQYQCNGVLAGIAICRLGFPNKLLYPDFKARYNILAAGAVAKAKNDKGAAGAVMDAIKLEKEKFRLGHTKVFFRAGILGFMEETREDKIGSVLALLQAQARGKASRLTFKKMQDQKLALYCLQRTIRNFRIGKTWLWWQLWLAVKPNLKCTKFAQYKAEYEAKIAEAEAHIGKALDDRAKVEAVHTTLLAQKNELVLALQSGGSAVQDIIDKTVRVEAMAADVQKQVDEVTNRIKGEKEEKNMIGQAQSKVTAQKGQLAEEISALEGRLGSAESDRADKDDQIRTCKEEIEHQNDMISKLGREKKGCQESRQKTEEDIQTMEDRCNHLSRVKAKLEQSLDEAEDSLEREKKSKGDVEKLKRKVEGDLKLTQETVSDLERMKAELTQGVQRKEKESAAIGAKIEDEATLGSKYSKQTKELQSRLEELDEELAIERGNRAKAEKSRAMLKKDLEDLGSRLEEAGANTATQVELNKKREAELARLKGELEELNIAHEGTLAALRMKHNNTMAELGEQIDGINGNKMKAEKDKAGMERDLQEARSNLEDAVRAKAEMDKNGKLLQGSIVDSHQKLDELARALNEADSQKKRLDVEKQDLERQIEEGEAAMANLNKNKISLTTQLEDTKRLGDAESRDRSSMLSKFKNLTTELENLRERIDDEHQRKSDALKALSKAQAEIQLWRSRYETEGLGRVDELESSRNKLQARIQEAEETVDSLQQKIANAEKSKGRMQSDLEEISMEYERTHAAAIITEKRGRNFDKVVGEWKSKAEDVSAEVDASQKECRNYNSELFRLKAAHDEVIEQLDVVKRENKNLADEIKDLLDQLGDGGRSIHELDKQRRRLEVEKEELQAALEEAEAALEQEENKVLRAQLELGQVRQEIDRKIQEKEEEFDNTRKNHQRAMDSLGASLEAEQRAKSEALRIKKKLESDINELEIALDHANKANSEGQKAIKRYQGALRDTIQGYEDESRSRQEVMEQVGISERKANALSGEVEESRALLDSADRAKRQLDGELADARNAVNEMGVINSRAMHDKRNVESMIHTLQAEIDDALAQAKNSEEKSKRAMVDAARLADELRSEQDHANAEGRGKRSLDQQLSELENRLAEAEASAMKGGKAAMSKLEMKIRELEVELGGVQSRTQENYKAFQRAERRIKELQFQQDEDKKNQDRMSDLAQKLQSKIKTYKQQIEEAEEIAALNLAKYRKAQQELEETEERSKLAEAQISTFSSF